MLLPCHWNTYNKTQHFCVSLMLPSPWRNVSKRYADEGLDCLDLNRMCVSQLHEQYYMVRVVISGGFFRNPCRGAGDNCMRTKRKHPDAGISMLSLTVRPSSSSTAGIEGLCGPSGPLYSSNKSWVCRHLALSLPHLQNCEGTLLSLIILTDIFL